ncbi:MAG TPA: Fic family protein [Bacillus bacterium]|nr:Fic family protein [Bacillus sp. (in: firmicutes)]
MKRKPFIPDELPLSLEVFDYSIHIRNLTDAASSLASYQTLLEHSKLPSNTFLRPVMYQEAVQSTKIEGTQVTLEEMFEADTKGKEETVDIREAMNYFRALEEAIKELKRIPISTRLFQLLHKILLSGNVRGGNRNPGSYRTTQNYIGPEGCTIETATFIPPEPQIVPLAISNLEKYINDDADELHPLIKVAIIHAQFETIHPFLDGNGRIGRILIPLYLYDVKLISFPNFFISDTLEKDKHKYYRYLNDTRYKKDWNQWIRFFLECIKIQADKNKTTLVRVNGLYEETLEKSNRLINSSNMKSVIDTLIMHPVINVKLLSHLTGINEPTCRRYLNLLEENKILFSDERVRNRTYFFYDLISLIKN